MTNTETVPLDVMTLVLNIGLPLVLSLGVLYGIKLMSRVKTAVQGNAISALCMLLAIIYVFLRMDVSGSLVYIILGLAVGTLISIVITVKVKMIQMPQMVGLLNGLGGLASALAAILTLFSGEPQSGFSLVTSGLALAVGALPFLALWWPPASCTASWTRSPKSSPGIRRSRC